MLLFYRILSTYLTCCCFFAGLTSPDYFGAESWSSENASQPASLTDSMAMVNRILIDEKMDRLGNTDIYKSRLLMPIQTYVLSHDVADSPILFKIAVLIETFLSTRHCMPYRA